MPQGELLAYWGSHQVLELAVNLGNAAETLHIKIEDVLDIEKVAEKTKFTSNATTQPII